MPRCKILLFVSLFFGPDVLAGSIPAQEVLRSIRSSYCDTIQFSAGNLKRLNVGQLRDLTGQAFGAHEVAVDSLDKLARFVRGEDATRLESLRQSLDLGMSAYGIAFGFREFPIKRVTEPELRKFHRAFLNHYKRLCVARRTPRKPSDLARR